MFLRWLQVIAVTVYIVVAIGVVAYLGLSPFWLVLPLAPAIYFIFTLPDISQADRNRSGYMDTVNRGVPYSAERIEYLESRDKLVLCEHLRPLEAAMRAANLPMDNHAPGQVLVNCIMREALIRQQIPLAESVTFSNIAGPHPHGPSVNIAECSVCRNCIEEDIHGLPWPAA